MATYQTYLSELADTFEEKTESDVLENLHDLRKAVTRAQKSFIFYPSEDRILEITEMFETLKRNCQRNRISEDFRKKMIALTSDLQRETLEFSRRYAAEFGGALVFASAIATFNHFIVDNFLSSINCMRVVARHLVPATIKNGARSIRVTKAFILNAISQGLVYAGCSVTLASTAASIILTVLIGLVAFGVALRYYPTQCHDFIDTLLGVVVLLVRLEADPDNIAVQGAIEAPQEPRFGLLEPGNV